MNGINKFTVLILVFSLLCGQTTFIVAQDTPKEQKNQKKQDEEEEPADEEEPEDEDMPDDEEKPAEDKTPVKTPVRKHKLKDKIFVGRGYDVTEKYADNESVRDWLFEIDADEDGNPVLMAGDESFPIESEKNVKTQYDEFSGKSLSEYQTKFSNNLSIAGSYKLFSASVSVNFGKDEAGSVGKEFTTMMFTVTNRTYRMPYNVNSKVLPEVREMIDNADPRELFERFGTHYIWEALVGGRVDYNVTADRSSSQKNLNLSVALKAAADAGLAKVSVENETAYSNSLKKMDETGSVKILTYGGSLDVGANVKQSLSAVAEWSKTVAESPELSKFSSRSLRGIWTLASTPARQSALEKAFANYVKGTEIKEAPLSLVVRRSDQLKRTGENWYARNSQNGPPYTIGVYTPVADPDNGWYVVGHSADRNNRPETAATIDSILVKEIGERGKLLREPTGFEEVYNDRNTRGWKDWSIWRANCPVGFVALGHFAKYGHDAPNINMPSDNPFRDVRCVSEGLVESAPLPTADALIYNGEGSSGRNIMVYAIRPAEGSSALDANFFYAHIPGNYGDPLPAKLKLYVLKDPEAAKTGLNRNRAPQTGALIQNYLAARPGVRYSLDNLIGGENDEGK